MDHLERLSLFMDGELPDAEVPAVHKHLLECEECRAALDDWTELEAAVVRATETSQTPWWRRLLERLF